MLTSFMGKFNEKDDVFKRSSGGITSKFEFNEEVANCFDDMVSRSVPFYDEIHNIILDLANRYCSSNDLIYDLGCSTGTTIQILNSFFKEREISPKFVGIDNSPHMIKKAHEKLAKSEASVKLLCGDIDNFEFEPAKIIIMNYTLQFIPVPKRERLLKKIYNALTSGGIFILSEKIKPECGEFDQLITDLYYDFKRRNGYSELEIARKREALDNVLIPITPPEQMQLLNRGGFSKVETIFRWYNFACFVGQK